MLDDIQVKVSRNILKRDTDPVVPGWVHVSRRTSPKPEAVTIHVKLEDGRRVKLEFSPEQAERLRQVLTK